MSLRSVLNARGLDALESPDEAVPAKNDFELKPSIFLVDESVSAIDIFKIGRECVSSHQLLVFSAGSIHLATLLSAAYLLSLTPLIVLVAPAPGIQKIPLDTDQYSIDGHMLETALEALTSSILGYTAPRNHTSSGICFSIVRAFVRDGVIEAVVGISDYGELFLSKDSSALCSEKLKELIEAAILMFHQQSCEPRSIYCLCPPDAPIESLLCSFHFSRPEDCIDPLYFTNITAVPRLPYSISDLSKLHLTHIVLLAGQSNMSGRGRIEDVTTTRSISEYTRLVGCPPPELMITSEDVSRGVLAYDPVDGWTAARYAALLLFEY